MLCGLAKLFVSLVPSAHKPLAQMQVQLLQRQLQLTQAQLLQMRLRFLLALRLAPCLQRQRLQQQLQKLAHQLSLLLLMRPLRQQLRLRSLVMLLHLVLQHLEVT
jgi:hypothetical protein